MLTAAGGGLWSEFGLDAFNKVRVYLRPNARTVITTVIISGTKLTHWYIVPDPTTDDDS